MRNLLIKKALAFCLFLGCIGLSACSTNSVESVRVPVPNLSGVWVDTSKVVNGIQVGVIGGGSHSFDTVYHIATLALNNGLFELSAPGFQTISPIGGTNPIVAVNKSYMGSYENSRDSLFLNYKLYETTQAGPNEPVDSSEVTHREAFRFDFMNDYLGLFYNSFVGIDTNAADTGVVVVIIRPTSIIWASTSLFKYGGAFNRVE